MGNSSKSNMNHGERMHNREKKMFAVVSRMAGKQNRSNSLDKGKLEMFHMGSLAVDGYNGDATGGPCATWNVEQKADEAHPVSASSALLDLGCA